MLAAYLKPRETGDAKIAPTDEFSEMLTTLGRVAEYYASDAQRTFKAQADLSGQFMGLWAATLRRLQGEEAAPVAAPEPGDKRFADAGLARKPLFRFSQTGLCADFALGR